MCEHKCRCVSVCGGQVRAWAPRNWGIDISELLNAGSRIQTLLLVSGKCLTLQAISPAHQ